MFKTKIWGKKLHNFVIFAIFVYNWPIFVILALVMISVQRFVQFNILGEKIYCFSREADRIVNFRFCWGTAPIMFLRIFAPPSSKSQIRSVLAGKVPHTLLLHPPLNWRRFLSNSKIITTKTGESKEPERCPEAWEYNFRGCEILSK